MEGWDNSLVEVSKLSIQTMLSLNNVLALLKGLQWLPVLIATGAEDILVSLRSSQVLASKFSDSVSISLFYSISIMWLNLENMLE